MAKIISVFGPPNSGKTTLSVAMSEALAEKGYDVCLVCCDKVVPTIPVLLPQSVTKANAAMDVRHSVGKILNCVDFSENDIIKQCDQVITVRNQRACLRSHFFTVNVVSHKSRQLLKKSSESKRLMIFLFFIKFRILTHKKFLSNQ